MRISFFCLWLALALPAVSAEIKINFGNFPVGQTPAGFHSALAGGGKPGDWQVVDDTVPSAFAPLTKHDSGLIPHAALAQLSGDPTDERFPMLIYDQETFADFKLTTTFKIVGGVLEQMAGIVFHVQNETNFYVIRVSALGHNLRFYKVVNGVRSDPIGPTLEVSAGQWYKLTIQCQGNQITCWLNDRLAMPALNDNTFAAGKFGFWTKSDAISHFGDTTITYTPRVPMAQTLVRGIMQKYPRILGLQVYALDDQGQPHIIASKDEKEIRQPGTDYEKAAITSGKVYFGRLKGAVVVTVPLYDRNGDSIASVRVKLKSFLGETQDAAVDRSRAIVTEMQAQAATIQDLTQ